MSFWQVLSYVAIGVFCAYLGHWEAQRNRIDELYDAEADGYSVGYEVGYRNAKDALGWEEWEERDSWSRPPLLGRDATPERVHIMPRTIELDSGQTALDVRDPVTEEEKEEVPVGA